MCFPAEPFPDRRLHTVDRRARLVPVANAKYADAGLRYSEPVAKAAGSALSAVLDST